jgi:hypothetical protein
LDLLNLRSENDEDFKEIIYWLEDLEIEENDLRSVRRNIIDRILTAK